MKRVALAAVVAACCVPVAPAAASTELNIMPHGEQQPGAEWAALPGILPADAQAKMYDRLTPLFRAVPDSALTPSADGSGYFKSARLLAEDDPSFVSSETVAGTAPQAGAVSARIRRDPYGVPHVYSDTDAGVIFGTGYVTAADRSLLLDGARTNGLAGAIDIPGVPAISLVLGLYDYQPSARVVKEVTRQQTSALEHAGADGKAVLADIDVYLAGINAWYARHRPGFEPFTRTDIYALNAIKAQFLGQGGGEEAQNALALDAFEHQLGRKAGTRAYEDLRQRMDPGSSVTTAKRFTAGAKVKVTGARGAVLLRRGSFRSAGVKLPGAAATASAAHLPQHLASNILIVSGKRSATGAPLFVGGPQIGYNYPGLTMEAGLYGPHIRVRGATSAPFPGYMLIGRGEGYAWSLTSASGDIVDTYAERLCGGSKTRYEYRGRCLKMETVNAGTIAKATKKVKVAFRRTVHGPVIGYAKTADGRRTVALAQRRSSRGKETDDQVFYRQMTYGKVHSASDFVRAAQSTPQTFNSFYASATESAFYTSGMLPKRPRGVNPDLPVDGRGRYEWQGYLKPAQHPQAIDPADGLIVNWNNKPAAGWPGSDERWGEGGIQRADLLLGELARNDEHTLTDVVAAMNAGATEDVRAARLWPTIAAVLAKGRAPSPRAAQLKALLDAWSAAGGSRVDANGDGRIDDPGAAILDSAWKAMTDVALCERLGKAGCAALETRQSRFDAPPGGQYGGWHQYMGKDLRSLLGEKVPGAMRLRYCGGGKLSRCAAGLWKALDQGGTRLASQQGTDPSAWRAPAGRMGFTPVPLTTMQYANRPSGIQQVMQFAP